MNVRIGAMMCLAAACAAPAAAQQADLQYRAPVPSRVTYVTVDSASTVMSGLPMMDGMKSTAHFRSVSEVAMTPADAGFTVTVVLKELAGSTSTPMGNMPITASNTAPVTFQIGPNGPDAEDLMDDMPPGVANPADMIGSAKAYSGLMLLPGRALALGESWTDTITVRPEIDEDITGEMTMITRGTYVADTVVAGVTLNVLRIVTESAMTMTGTVQGMSVSSVMSGMAEERVLWDSARHYPHERESSGTMKTETQMPGNGMSVTMTADMRSRTTATLQQ